MYKNFADETNLHQGGIRLATAALIKCQMNLALAGPHLAIHRNVKQIISRLKFGVDRDVHREVRRIFTTGPPRKCYGSSTDRHFWDYYYGNHASACSDQKELMKVLVKDSRRGNVILCKADMRCTCSTNTFGR